MLSTNRANVHGTALSEELRAVEMGLLQEALDMAYLWLEETHQDA